jgi:hypothetical protein
MLQHLFVIAVGKAQVFNINAATLERAIVRSIALLTAIHQFENTLAGHHRLLQNRLLRRQLNQRLIQTPEVVDKGIEHAHANASLTAEAKQHQQATQHQRRKQAEQRTQKETIQPQSLHTRV